MWAPPPAATMSATLMDPTTLYFGLCAFAVFIGVASLAAAKGPTRECPQCGDRVVLTARRCKACHFRFT
jgi:hypothetical protein